jgi:hypothetical protein
MRIFLQHRKSLWPVVPVALVGASLLAGCGTTSDLQTAQGVKVAPSHKYSKVVVQNFKVAVAEHAHEAASSAILFPDAIAGELRKEGHFSNISRSGPADANTLVIDGVVTKYDEGSQSKRMWLGMGFGMAFLEATVKFSDSKGNVIGSIKVDKNSWAMGGGLAAGQNPNSFMDDAADKISEEAAKFALK